jgi:hypothetical protein
MKTKANIPVPKVGDSIYVDTSLYVTHGADDFIGGLCEVASVKEEWGTLWVCVKEDPETLYGWPELYKIQDRLKSEFGNKRGYKRPDYRKEFNEL